MQQTRCEQLTECHPDKVADHSLLGRVQGSKGTRAPEMAVPVLLDSHSDQRQTEYRFMKRKPAHVGKHNTCSDVQW